MIKIDGIAIDWFVVRTFLDSARETQKPGFCVKSRENTSIAIETPDSARETQKPGFCVKSRENTSIAIETRFLGLSAKDSAGKSELRLE
ncbi:MAG: hypothetical protein EAZ93_02885 [Oscillatoriales cyanobacterium]|nr:MAG: hypothetical protein EAZ93_02885 [Oscillatoriales cyanobacterium]